MTALIGCVLYLGVTAALLRPARIGVVHPPAPLAAVAVVPDEPSWRFRNPDFNQWVEEVRHEKEAVAAREQQLQELEKRIAVDREELSTATQTVAQLQAEFDRNVLRLQDQEIVNLKRQAKVLAGMSPEGAAGLINQMPDDDAVRILYTMKTDEAGAILETLSKMGEGPARRAALLTERMRRALPPATAQAPRSSS
jgi:flagellar motility protein MotE (MotC chaperone)